MLAQSRKPWLGVMERLEAFASQEGLEFEPRNPGAPEYQIALLVGAAVRLVIYPHRSTNGNQHARVRNENSIDRQQAAALMERVGLAVNNAVLRP